MQNIKELKSKRFFWIDIDQAAQDNLKYLKNEFNFDTEDLNDALPTLNRQKIHIRDKYTFMVLQFPYFDPNTGIIKPAEVDIFINKKFLVTIHDGRIKPLYDFFSLCQTDQLMKSQLVEETSWSVFNKILHKLYYYCYPIINNINQDIEMVEDDILARPEEETVVKILNIKRNIVNFQKIIQAHRNILQRFIESIADNPNLKQITADAHNLVSHTKDIWDYLATYKDTINALHETQESMTSLKINEIMKTLTIFSVIVFPLTLLAAIFGMNTINGMPFLERGNGFWYVIGIMLVGMLVMFWYFRKRRWI